MMKLQPDHMAQRLIIWLRSTSGLALGVALLIGALVAMALIAENRNRGAILSEAAMTLSMPFVVVGFFLWIAGLLLLASGWPPGEDLTTALLALAGLVVGLLVMVALGDRFESFRIMLIILILVYVAIGAAVREVWMLYMAPAVTVAVAFIIFWWGALAIDSHSQRAEIDMAGGIVGFVIWVILFPIAFVSTGVGLILGAVFTTAVPSVDEVIRRIRRWRLP